MIGFEPMRERNRPGRRAGSGRARPVTKWTWSEEKEFLFQKFHRFVPQLRSAYASLLEAAEQRGPLPSIHRPSELIERVGTSALFLPQFWEAIHDLAERAHHPYWLIHGRASESLEVDERKDSDRSKQARAELDRVFRRLAAADPNEMRKPRTYWRERMLDRYEHLLREGKPRKAALRVVTDEENARRQRSPVADSRRPLKLLDERKTEAHLSKARRAREDAGRQVLRSRSRTLVRKKS
jgi:hypothetical protein